MENVDERVEAWVAEGLKLLFGNEDVKLTSFHGERTTTFLCNTSDSRERAVFVGRSGHTAKALKDFLRSIGFAHSRDFTVDLAKGN